MTATKLKDAPALGLHSTTRDDSKGKTWTLDNLPPRPVGLWDVIPNENAGQSIDAKRAAAATGINRRWLQQTLGDRDVQFGELERLVAQKRIPIRPPAEVAAQIRRRRAADTPAVDYVRGLFPDSRGVRSSSAVAAELGVSEQELLIAVPDRFGSRLNSPLILESVLRAVARLKIDPPQRVLKAVAARRLEAAKMAFDDTPDDRRGVVAELFRSGRRELETRYGRLCKSIILGEPVDAPELMKIAALLGHDAATVAEHVAALCTE